jgi:hypothetical protein
MPRPLTSLLRTCALAMLVVPAAFATPPSPRDPQAIPPSARAQAAAPNAPADLVLHGEIDGHANHSYLTLPFDVPVGVARITVQFEYQGREEKTAIDLGVLGPGEFTSPDGFRGWSGGNKSLFTVSATDATPSYLAGPVRPGTWSLLLGIPNIRATSHAKYSARIWFGRKEEPYWEPAVLAPNLRSEPGWYRGDLHMHDAHSDGSCKSQSGAKVPCPLFLTAQTAAARGLDFIAITDHNTASQAGPIRELQPYFDRLLLIPGREITTFSGHANLFGSVAPLDFRVTGPRTWNDVLRDARNLQAVVSINHPIRPSDERCMGCGWTPSPAADPALLQAVEVVNGLDADTPYSGIGFWQTLLNEGHRLTAIGGSDNHEAGKAASDINGGAIGSPTTVVHARSLSMPAILQGLRAGHAFVDVQGSRDRLLEFSARAGAASAQMGDAIVAASGQPVGFEVHVANAAGARVEVIVDGALQPLITDPAVTTTSQRLGFQWRSDGKAHWLRVDVRGGDGKLMLVGNPIYVNPLR